MRIFRNSDLFLDGKIDGIEAFADTQWMRRQIGIAIDGTTFEIHDTGEVRVMIVTILFQATLWIWFLGCTTTYRLGKYTLVEGMGIKSAEFATLCLYSIGLLLFHLLRPAGKWMLLAILILWFVVEFFCHWYFTIFGVSESKLKGYNECFRNTIRVFPMSETRLVPDLYHIVQHALILSNIIICLAR